MNKMRCETKNITESNIDIIAAHFPNCITETRDDRTHQLKRAVNFEALKQMLSDEVVEGQEAFEFTWVGKKAAMVEANRPIRKTLRPCPEESVNWDTTQNLYIEGDNLDVLKLLQESYLGKVKVIYIDPPYNTGKDDNFIYKDNFITSAEAYTTLCGEINDVGERLFVNTEANGRFHSDWCSMMYSRLQLARNLLTDDGVIFISIDDHEQANLKKIGDEVFGENNFIAIFSWVKKKKGSHLSKSVRSMTEYVVSYAKAKDNIELYGEEAYSDKKQPLAKRTNSHKTLKIKANIIQTTLLDGHYEGKQGTGTSALTFEGFDVHNNIVTSECIVSGPFIWTQEKLDTEIGIGSRIFLSNQFGFNVLRSDQEDKIKRPSTLIDSKNGVGTNEDAYDESKELFNQEGIMSYPKPTSLLKYLVKTLTYSDKDSVVLDFFSGSATTAHAVMQLNAEDSGSRKFIMVQLPEPCPKDKEAYKAGYATIAEIGKERIRRAGKKILADFPDAKPDIGFRVFKLDSTNMKEVYYSADQYQQTELASLISNVKDDRSDLDLLFGCLLEWGLPLSLPHTSESIENCTVHNYNEGDLIACFDDNIPDSVLKEIAKRQPLRAVFRDSGFNGSPAKINVGEIFKMLAPHTQIRVI